MSAVSLFDLNDTPLRARLRAALARGGADEVARLAGNTSASWPERGAAACALLDAGRLGPEHGADVFEALVRDLLAQADVHGAAQAAMAVAHLSGDAEPALARIEAWRALCGVPQADFWGEADDGAAAGATLRDEVAGRAWVTPPDASGQYMAYAEFTPRGPVPGDECVRSAAVVGITGDRIHSAGYASALTDTAELDLHRERALASGGVEGPVAELGVVDAPAGPSGLLAALRRDRPEPRGALPTLDEALALIRRPETIGGWFFSATDLGEHDPDAPIDRLVPALDQPWLAARTVTAARAVARWWRWAGDRAAAGAFAALAAEAEQGWRGSVLLRALILCSRRQVALPPERAPKVPTPLRFMCVDPLLAPSYAAQIASAFAASPEGRARAARGSKLAWARVLVHYGLAVHHQTPLAWSPDLLRALLFSTLPQQATATGRDAAEILADLDAFVAFLAGSWALPNAAALARMLAAAGTLEDVVDALDDRSMWHPAKAALVKARDAGMTRAQIEAMLGEIGAEDAFDDGSET